MKSGKFFIFVLHSYSSQYQFEILVWSKFSLLLGEWSSVVLKLNLACSQTRNKYMNVVFPWFLSLRVVLPFSLLNTYGPFFY